MIAAKNSDWLKDWLVIVNPNSGNGKGSRDWPQIRKILLVKGFVFREKLTGSRGHAVQIATDYVSKAQIRKIIVVGGDGTLKEVANGIMLSGVAAKDVILAMIPLGTGNDWGRTYGIQGSYEELSDIIVAGNTFLQDAGKVEYMDENGKGTRYFMNVAGAGYDALVAQRTNFIKEKGRGGPFAYLVQLAKGLFMYRQERMVVETEEGIVNDETVFSVTLGICKYNGSGMKQVPAAVPDDGMLDIVIIRGASKFYILRNVYKVYSGAHLKLPIVKAFRARRARLESKGEKRLSLETDGESLGEGPLEFSVLPAAFTVVIPGGWREDQASTQSP
jgi:YegS/Rv2252/BmrU family lipid kinase